eukprot:2916926-Amphidinium_carterae.1
MRARSGAIGLLTAHVSSSGFHCTTHLWKSGHIVLMFKRCAETSPNDVEMHQHVTCPPASFSFKTTQHQMRARRSVIDQILRYLTT